MPKKRKRQDWTTKEIRHLRAVAGRYPLDEICMQLGRSERSVCSMAHRMRLSLRCSVSGLVWCNRCASWRSRLVKKTGNCRICRARDRLDRVIEKTMYLYSRLSIEDRASFEESMRKRDERLTKPTSNIYATCYSHGRGAHKKSAATRLAVNLETYELERIEKLIDAEQALARNMRKKLPPL